MRRWIWITILACLLAGGTTLCIIRWEAWFGNPPEPEWEGEVINYQFPTFANDSLLLSRQTDTLTFLLLGDIHNSLSHDELCILSDRHPQIDFYAQLGDWMERPYLYYEQMMYQSLLGTGLDSLPVIAVPGNHEYLKGIRKTLPEHWKTIFPNPQNGPKRFLGTTYFVDFPHLRIITIDTDGLHTLSDYTQVCFWLNQKLQEASNKFTVVLMHHPISSTAKGRQNPLMWLTFHSVMRYADVVFSGHDHNYARYTINYKKRWWTEESPTEFISTNASKKVYANKENSKYKSTFSGEPVYQYLHSTPDTLYIRTKKLLTGELIDQVTIQH